ncbi:MAG: EAL domain-containing protein [Lysobacterales bacterium]
MRAGGASIIRWGLLTGLYFAGTVVASLYLHTPQDITLFWPCAGIGYVFVLRYGARAAAVIPVGILLMHLLFVPVPPLFLPFSVGSNLFGALAAGAYVRRRHPQPIRLVAADGLLLLRGGLLLCIASTAIGSLGLVVADMIPLRDSVQAMVLWFLGDLLGATSTVPGLMLLFAHFDEMRPLQRTRDAASALEHAIWLVALCLSLGFVFVIGRSGSPYALALVSMPLAVLMWSAVRFNPLWTTVATFATVLFLSLTTGLGLGSFVRPPTAIDAAMLILLLCLISILPLLMAAADHEKRMAAAALYRRATRDPITGLLNRATFAERSRQRLAASDGELAMLYLDLDQFKLVNSSNGHAAGDELLRNVGNVVRSEAGANALVARIGGDEFALLVDSGRDQATALARKLTGGIEALRPAWNGNMLAITASIGMVPSEAPHAGFDALLSQAGAACAAAKEHGGGRFRVTLPDSDESRLRTAVMRSAMRVRAAIDERRFVPYCQSIVPLRAANDGRRHFEVLLRMVEPDGGILPPAEFIAAAERYQLGPRLDRHVIDLVLDWLEQHPDAARDIGTCSINLGGGTLVDDEFRDDLHARLRRGQFPPDKLCLEITETSVARDRGRAQRFIGRMRELGCRFALDDFGTGFCSFSYLRDLDVDFLKIDGSFVRDMDSSPLAGAVVRSITDIAHVLDKRAIAEHVEDLRQREALAAIGVDYMQGYAIDRPMPIDDYFSSAPRWIASASSSSAAAVTAAPAPGP